MNARLFFAIHAVFIPEQFLEAVGASETQTRRKRPMKAVLADDGESG